MRQLKYREAIDEATRQAMDEVAGPIVAISMMVPSA